MENMNTMYRVRIENMVGNSIDEMINDFIDEIIDNTIEPLQATIKADRLLWLDTNSDPIDVLDTIIARLKKYYL